MIHIHEHKTMNYKDLPYEKNFILRKPSYFANLHFSQRLNDILLMLQLDRIETDYLFRVAQILWDFIARMCIN